MSREAELRAIEEDEDMAFFVAIAKHLKEVTAHNMTNTVDTIVKTALQYNTDKAAKKKADEQGAVSSPFNDRQTTKTIFDNTNQMSKSQAGLPPVRYHRPTVQSHTSSEDLENQSL